MHFPMRIMDLYSSLGLCTLINIVVSAHLHVSTKDSKQIVYAGGNVTLPCSVLGSDFNAFLNPIIWYKVSHDEEAQYQINTGAVILPPFDNTNRYMILPDQVSQPDIKVNMPLMINDVTLAENGTYRCELRSRYKVLSTVTHRIIVPAAVTEITFTSNTSTQEHRNNGSAAAEIATFLLNERQPAAITCRVHGGNPRPQLHIYQDNVDISTSFQRTESVSVVGRPGLQSVVHDIQLFSSGFHVSALNRGDVLKCVAKMTRFAHLQKTRSRVLEVRYAPKFKCSRKVSAFLWVANFTIECSVHSNPALDSNSVHWSFEDTGINESVVQNNMFDGDTMGTYTSTNKMNAETGSIDASLTIGNVTRDAYKTYNVVATNSIGTTRFSISFSQAVTTIEPSTKSGWDVKLSDKDVYNINSENDVIKASSSHSGAPHGGPAATPLLALTFLASVFLL